MLTLDHLEPATRLWVEAVRHEYDLDQHHDRLLILAAQAFDRAEQARYILDHDGIMIPTGAGGKKAHPAVAIARDARIASAFLLRELTLDMTGADVARPPPLASNRG